jgi:hypothetical protein
VPNFCLPIAAMRDEQPYQEVLSCWFYRVMTDCIVERTSVHKILTDQVN